MGAIMAHTSTLQLSRPSMDVMYILVNAAHADGKIQCEEIKLILEASRKLDIRTDDGEPVSPADLLGWLEANHAGILTQYSGGQREIELIILITRMARRDDLAPISRNILDICQADANLDSGEKSLLTMIGNYWG